MNGSGREGEKLKDEAKSADAADLKRSFDLTHGTCFNRSPQMPHREQKVGTADLNQAREAWGSGYMHFGQDNPMSSPAAKQEPGTKSSAHLQTEQLGEESTVGLSLGPLLHCLISHCISSLLQYF